MSAPTTHDPLVVNTQDGSCWTRRAVNRAGRGLYALADVRGPELVLATLIELAEHGLSSMSMHALPVPVGAEPEQMPANVAMELYDLRTRLAAMANPPRDLFLALYDGAEPELFTTVEAARECCDDLAKTDAYGKCWDWTVNEHGVHVQFWTHPDDDRPLSETPGSVTPIVVQGDEPLSELERLRAEVAALREERHSTNEALDDAVRSLREPLTVFRASHDSIVMGLYTTREAAMDHVHGTLANEEGGDVQARVIWRADDPEADEPEWECWLFDSDMDDDKPTGYVVTPVEVSAQYDPDADE